MNAIFWTHTDRFIDQGRALLHARGWRDWWPFKKKEEGSEIDDTVLDIYKDMIRDDPRVAGKLNRIAQERAQRREQEAAQRAADAKKGQNPQTPTETPTENPEDNLSDSFQRTTDALQGTQENFQQWTDPGNMMDAVNNAADSVSNSPVGKAVGSALAPVGAAVGWTLMSGASAAKSVHDSMCALSPGSC